MIKQMAIAKRRPDMTHREYLEYIEHVHGVLSRKYNPGTLVKYVQNHIYDSAFGYRPDKAYQINAGYDSITELYFEDFPSMGMCFGDPNIIKYIASDGENFAEESLTIPLVVQEHEVEVSNPQENGMKVVYYIKKQDGIDIETYHKLWDEANAEILPEMQGVYRYIKNIPVAMGNSEHFHNDGSTNYEGCASVWVDSMESFRKYQRAMEAKSEGFFSPTHSFFVCCDEVYIIR